MVANKQEYLASLRSAIAQLHGCGSVYLKTEHVHAALQGKTVWNGEVEVFSLINYQKVRHAYAWAELEGGKDDKTRLVVVLEMPPVKDARTAVQASIMAGSKTDRS